MIALADSASNIKADGANLPGYSALYKILIIGILVIPLAGIDQCRVKVKLLSNAFDDLVGISEPHLSRVLLKSSS
jgi:hypothetical protein